jgi:hypothetical protein
MPKGIRDARRRRDEQVSRCRCRCSGSSYGRLSEGAWLIHNHRMATDDERPVQTSETMMPIAVVRFALRRLALCNQQQCIPYVPLGPVNARAARRILGLPRPWRRLRLLASEYGRMSTATTMSVHPPQAITAERAAALLRQRAARHATTHSDAGWGAGMQRSAPAFV